MKFESFVTLMIHCIRFKRIIIGLQNEYWNLRGIYLIVIEICKRKQMIQDKHYEHFTLLFNLYHLIFNLLRLL